MRMFDYSPDKQITLHGKSQNKSVNIVIAAK